MNQLPVDSLKPAVAQALIKGCSLARRGEYSEALKFFNRAVEIEPQCSDAWYQRGCCYGDLHNHEKAIDDYDKAIEIDPGNEKAWIGKANSLMMMGREVDAFKYLNRARTLRGDWSNDSTGSQRAPGWQEWLHKAEAYYQKGNYKKALHYYNKIIKTNPECISAWLGKAITLKNKKRYEAAVDCLQRILEIEPSFSSVRLLLSECYSALGEAKLAEQYAGEARIANTIHDSNASISSNRVIIKLDEDDRDSTNDLLIKGQALKSNCQFDAALEQFNHYTAVKPDRYAGWLSKGECLMLTGQYDDALDCLDKALEINESCAPAWDLKGAILHHQRAYAIAIESYKRAIKEDPYYAIAWYGISLSLHEMGENQEAMVWLEKGLAINPNNPKLLGLREHLK